MNVTSTAALPLLVVASLLAGCATHSDGSAPLNQRTWPLCSLLGGLAGGGLGAIESSAWAAAGGALGAVITMVFLTAAITVPIPPPGSQQTIWAAR